MIELPELRRVEPPRDKRWDKLQLPHPSTGKIQLWSRPSTLARTLDDDFNLTEWKKRMTAKGLAMRPDLLQLAYATDLDDRRQWKYITEQAMEAAGANVRRNIGTALHGLTHMYDVILERNDPLLMEEFSGSVPASLRPDLAVYARTMKALEVHRPAQWRERMTVCTALDASGTADYLGRRRAWLTEPDADGLPRILDLKTGGKPDEIEYHMIEWCIQMASYAFGDVMVPMVWDHSRPEDITQYERMPAVSRKWAHIIHLPSGHDHCLMYRVDLRAGFELAKLANQVRDGRKRKDLVAAEAEHMGLISEETPPAQRAEAPSMESIHVSVVLDPAPFTPPSALVSPAPGGLPAEPIDIGEGVATVKPTPRKRAARKPRGAVAGQAAEAAAEARTAVAGRPMTDAELSISIDGYDAVNNATATAEAAAMTAVEIREAGAALATLGHAEAAAATLDRELPGMWESADSTGGATDVAEPAVQQPAAPMSEAVPGAALGSAGWVDAINGGRPVGGPADPVNSPAQRPAAASSRPEWYERVHGALGSLPDGQDALRGRRACLALVANVTDRPGMQALRAANLDVWCDLLTTAGFERLADVERAARDAAPVA